MGMDGEMRGQLGEGKEGKMSSQLDQKMSGGMDVWIGEEWIER